MTFQPLEGDNKEEVIVKIFNRSNNVNVTSSDAFPEGVVGKETTKKSGAMSFMRDIFDKATSLRPGSIAETICDRLGLPESLGDVAGIFGSLATMNLVEVTEHAADLCKDVAERTGHDKLAGFCEAYEQKVGNFNKITGKLAFMVGSTLATGGAGAAALGASTGAVSIGGVTMSGAQLFQCVGLVDRAIGAGESWEGGDKMGALKSVLGVAGDALGMGELVGLDPKQIGEFQEMLTKGGSVLNMCEGLIGADGGVNKGQLGKLLLTALGQTGVADNLSGSDNALLQSIAGMLGDDAQFPDVVSQLLTQVASGALEGSNGEGKDAINQIVSLLVAGQNAPEEMGFLGQLFNMAAHGQQELKAYQLADMKV